MEFFLWKPNFEDDFSAKTEMNERMKTNIAAAKYGQAANGKPLTGDRGLPFVVRLSNLDLKVSNKVV